MLYWGSVCRNLPSPPSFLLLCHQSPTKIEDETAKKERKKEKSPLAPKFSFGVIAPLYIRLGHRSIIV